MFSETNSGEFICSMSIVIKFLIVYFVDGFCPRFHLIIECVNSVDKIVDGGKTL